MHDFYYTRLLSDPTRFQPREGNRVVEFHEDGNASLACIQRDIAEPDIPAWLRTASPTSTETDTDRPKRVPLKLLIGSPEEHLSDAKILPLPFSSATFETIRSTWNMPTELLRMLQSSLPLSVPFTTADEKGRTLKGLMIRGARSRDWNFCLAILHNPAECSTVGILNGMQESEVQSLLDCLIKSKAHMRNPMLVPVFLIELRVHYFAILLEKRALGIEEIEYATGMRHGFSQDPHRNRMIDRDSRDKLKTLDFHTITQKLTGVTGTLSFCNLMFQSSRKALALVTSLRPLLDPEYATSVTEQALDRRIEYLNELIAGSQALGDVLAARTKAQVQTVYSLIGQRDNAINKEISETGLLHNEAMKVIAEDSKQVAILTRRDSIDMRIIAAVTLVFLPGTFVATVFGSNLFRFLPDHGSAVVSKWIWLYCVLTVAITIAVLLFWWQLTKGQLKNDDLEKDSKNGSNSTGSFSIPRKGEDSVSSPQPISLGLEHTRSQSRASRGSLAEVDPFGPLAPSRRQSLWHATDVP